MKQKPIVELLVGLFVLAGIACLMLLAVQISGLGEFYKVTPEYSVTAKFGNIAGLKPRARVAIAGVDVGKVSNIELDPETYEAVVTLTLVESVKLPLDTAASIYTSGLIGNNYISLLPGAEEEYLADGDEIIETQSGLVLEELVGKYLFSAGEAETVVE
jgi:phospholipid/cholesterol/gamma-HCH transport system substrate-binding protein